MRSSVVLNTINKISQGGDTVKKVSLSLLLSLLLLAILATVAMAEGPAGTQDPIGGYNEEAELKNIQDINLNAHNTNGSSKSGGRHGNYTNNTNACSTCHQTHTASSKNLIFADSVYQSCIACHDGTSGGATRNVLNTDYNYVLDRNSPGGAHNNVTTAGTFAGTTHGNMSVHLTTGAVAIKAAPGGNPNGDGAAFTCASCHNPHGSYSNKYLHQNPNGMASVPVEEGGRRLKDVEVVNSITGQGDYYLVRSTKTAEGLTGRGNPELENIIVLKRKVGSAYVLDKSPWLAPSSRYGIGWDLVGDATYTVVRDHGFIEGTSEELAKITKANKLDRAYYVELPTNRADLWASGSHLRGIQMSEFCASCHNDYLVKSGGTTSLWNDEKTIYGHTTNSNSYTCVRCHYAHGSTAEIMIDAKGESITSLVNSQKMTQEAAFNHIKDVNPSSALKKFTNMSSCWACHNSSKNTNIVNTSRKVSGQDNPTGMPAGR
jgi:predicted CXXCH cytochrome family protein